MTIIEQKRADWCAEDCRARMPLDEVFRLNEELVTLFSVTMAEQEHKEALTLFRAPESLRIKVRVSQKSQQLSLLALPLQLQWLSFGRFLFPVLGLHQSS